MNRFTKASALAFLEQFSVNENENVCDSQACLQRELEHKESILKELTSNETEEVTCL